MGAFCTLVKRRFPQNAVQKRLKTSPGKYYKKRTAESLFSLGSPTVMNFIINCPPPKKDLPKPQQHGSASNKTDSNHFPQRDPFTEKQKRQQHSENNGGFA